MKSNHFFSLILSSLSITACSAQTVSPSALVQACSERFEHAPAGATKIDITVFNQGFSTLEEAVNQYKN